MKTIQSKAIVYTYGFNLTKTNTGVYHRVTTGGSERVATGDEGNLGKLKLRGLDTGSYRLKEIQAPEGGYVVLKNYVTFAIKDEKLANGQTGIDGIPEDDKGENLASADGANGYVGLTVENSKGFDLPLTGGIGTVLFTAGGIALVISAVVLLLVANRKKSRRS